MAVRECLPCMVLLKIIIKVQCSTNNSVFLYTKHMDTELQTPQLNVLFLKWSVSQPKWGQLFSRGAWAPSRPTGWTCARPSAPVCHSIPTPHGFLLPLTQYCFVSILLCVQLSRSLCFSWRLSRSYRWALLCCHNLAGWPRPSPQPAWAQAAVPPLGFPEQHGAGGGSDSSCFTNDDDGENEQAAQVINRTLAQQTIFQKTSCIA